MEQIKIEFGVRCECDSSDSDVVYLVVKASSKVPFSLSLLQNPS